MELKRWGAPSETIRMTQQQKWQVHLLETALEAGLGFDDYRKLREVNRCESSWRHFNSDGSVVVATGNIGLAQINRYAWEETYTATELDVNDPFDNLEFEVWLYKSYGLKPWLAWSGHCFLPRIQGF